MHICIILSSSENWVTEISNILFSWISLNNMIVLRYNIPAGDPLEDK